MRSLKGNLRRGTAFFERDVINFCLFPLILILFSGFSFFLGGYNCIKNTLRTYKNVNSASLQVKPVIFPECGLDYHDYTPCTDPKVSNKLTDISIWLDSQFLSSFLV